MNQKGYPCTKIQEKLNCGYSTLRKLMKENNIIRNTHYHLKDMELREDYFSTIDTEEKAYLLGLFKTDGYIKTGKGSPRIGISLKKSDLKMIEKIKEEFNTINDIYYDNRVGKESYVIEVVSERMATDLEKFNIIPNKTILLKDIHLESIPEHLQRHYLRGLLDGDGTIYIEKATNTIAIGFCGYNKSFVYSFQKAINEKINYSIESNIKKDNAYSCRWKGNKISYKILRYLYEDSRIFLSRKKAFYLELLLKNQV